MKLTRAHSLDADKKTFEIDPAAIQCVFKRKRNTEGGANVIVQGSVIPVKQRVTRIIKKMKAEGAPPTIFHSGGKKIYVNLPKVNGYEREPGGNPGKPATRLSFPRLGRRMEGAQNDKASHIGVWVIVDESPKTVRDAISRAELTAALSGKHDKSPKPHP